MRLPLYPIPAETYLYPAKLSAQGVPNTKEEPVRQWCAFELIRAYGIKVADLSFEQEVRIGSKTYRIDILVKRNGLPWIVVECKEPKHTKPEEGLEQAVSYAGSVKIMAEYAVYTNGTAWQVKRRIENEWTAVPDIPVSGPARPLGSIDELLRTVELVSPLLHKLDEPLQGNDARLYLEALQLFFHGANLITSGVDEDLRMATDCLLRVLSTGPDNEHYSRSKLVASANRAEAFRMKTGIGFELPEIQESEHVCAFMNAMSLCLHPLLEAGRGVEGANQSLIRLFLSLLSYGARQAGKNYPLFPAHLHASIREFLTKAMALTMDVRVPEALDEEFTSDMSNFTRPAWERLAQENNRQQQELRRDFLDSIISPLCFWRYFARKQKRARP